MRFPTPNLYCNASAPPAAVWAAVALCLAGGCSQTQLSKLHRGSDGGLNESVRSSLRVSTDEYIIGYFFQDRSNSNFVVDLPLKEFQALASNLPAISMTRRSHMSPTTDMPQRVQGSVYIYRPNVGVSEGGAGIIAVYGDRAATITWNFGLEKKNGQWKLFEADVMGVVKNPGVREEASSSTYDREAEKAAWHYAITNDVRLLDGTEPYYVNLSGERYREVVSELEGYDIRPGHDVAEAQGNLIKPIAETKGTLISQIWLVRVADLAYVRIEVCTPFRANVRDIVVQKRSHWTVVSSSRAVGVL